MIETSTTNETQEDIVTRLEELNKWQDQQKKLLEERQNMQRQMLGMEQRNMLGILGLLEEPEGKPGREVGGDGDKNTYPELKPILKKPQTQEMSTAGGSVNNNAGEKTKLKTIINLAGLCTEEQDTDLLKPKRAYLKRGEGLKQRFKIDPEELRLNNLPRYKYANAHSKYRKKDDQQIQYKVTICKEASQPAPHPPPAPLDAQEKRFQQLLFSSRHICNSTPDIKSANSSQSPKLPRVRFMDYELAPKTVSETTLTQQESHNSTLSSDMTAMPKISWAKVLDSQAIVPMDVKQLRSSSATELQSRRQPELDDDNLSIFELLEKKANEGSIDMNSSSIKKFFQRIVPNKYDDNDRIPVERRFEEAGLNPMVGDVLDDDSTCSESSDNKEDECETGNISESMDNAKTDKVHVRFSESHNTYDYTDNTASDSSEVTGDENTLGGNSDLLQQLKEVVFMALQSKTQSDQSDTNNCSNDTVGETLTPQSSVSILSDDLQEKTSLIKIRLANLEKEIAAFQVNNIELMKSKQEHEMEKAQYEVQHMEAMERLKDEKIQMEIYLHDERMKIEEEKRGFEQQIRQLKASTNRKERIELAQLKQDMNVMQLQLKQKDQAHATAQARLRAQIRTMEKDQKALYDDIERLSKENKKLENEIWKIGRENNNKMLQEINRNIAKLAPKLSSGNSGDEETARRPKKFTSSMAPSCKMATKKNVPAQKEKSAQNPISSGYGSRYNGLAKNSIPDTASSSSVEPRRLPEVNEHSEASFDDDIDGDFDDDCADFAQEVQAHTSKKSTQAKAMDTNNNGQGQDKGHENAQDNTYDNGQDFKREIINSDGSKDILYPNGNIKKITADGMTIRMLYFNKDIKETNINEGTVKYYYAATNTWHTTYLDGLEILEFPNGQTEHRYKNGVVEIHFPNNSVKVTNPADENKLEDWRFADGTSLIHMRNGDKVLTLPNGQKEFHTKLYKRREYPDGTVKLVYPDGSQETRYSNGRVRLKDKDGKLVMDSESS